MTDSRRIAVFGAGSWGTALAIQVARAGLDVCLWDRDPEHIERMSSARANPYYLPDIQFPDSLRLSADLTQTLADAQTLLLVVPSHAFRSFVQKIRDDVRPDRHVAWATKGLEEGTSRLMHQVIAEELPQCHSTVALSGPTFAREVARNLPTAITVASSTRELAGEVAGFLHHGNFRAYTSDDIIGVELGGSLKNSLAIAAGIADGLGFGANTRAALITRGLAEIMRLGDKMGAQRDTFMGLAGLGDLVLTCTDNQSRNRQMGLKLAEGKTIEQAREEIGQAVEGVFTTREAVKLGQQHQVELPIIEQTYKVLYEGQSPGEAVHELLARQAKHE